jgi:hypothetical protein
MLFRALMENDQFRSAFLVRLSDFVNSRFSTEHLVQQIELFAALYRPEIQEHIDRWRIMMLSTEEWERRVEEMVFFAEHRPEAIMRQIARLRRLSVGGYSTLSIGTTAGGSVQLNSLEGLRGDWSGFYPHSIPLRLTAIPDDGYRYSGWTSAGSEPDRESAAGDDAPGSTLEIVLSDHVRIEAAFEPERQSDR